jgi:periplasmic protein TonB
MNAAVTQVREWGVVAPAARARRLAVIVALHAALGVILLTTGAVTRARVIVPVSLALYLPPNTSPPEAVELPKPKPQVRDARLREEVPEVVLARPEVPVTVSLVIPARTPEVVTAPAAPPSVEQRVAVPRVQLPLSAADYLNNPAPPYPPVSKRLREEGRVLLWVLVSAEGLPQKIELRKSSGFNRLDEVAAETVQRWKFVPGMRNGAAEAMWVEVPIDFRLV